MARTLVHDCVHEYTHSLAVSSLRMTVCTCFCTCIYTHAFLWLQHAKSNMCVFEKGLNDFYQACRSRSDAHVTHSRECVAQSRTFYCLHGPPWSSYTRIFRRWDDCACYTDQHSLPRTPGYRCSTWDLASHNRRIASSPRSAVHTDKAIILIEFHA
jgi:hypothetical protein